MPNVITDTPDTLLLINRRVDAKQDSVSRLCRPDNLAQHYVLSSLMTWCRKPARLQFNFPLDKLYATTTSMKWCVIHEACVPACDTILWFPPKIIYLLKDTKSRNLISNIREFARQQRNCPCGI